MDIYDVIESLPDTAMKLGIFVGNNRQRLTKVNTYEAPLPDEEEILDELSKQGFGDEFKFARLRWRDGKGAQLKSFSMTSSSHAETEKGDYFNGALTVLREMNQNLLDDNRRLNNKLDKCNEFLMEVAKDREERNKSQREELTLAIDEALGEKAAAVSLDIELQGAKAANKTAWLEPVTQIVYQLGTQFIAKMPVPDVNPDNLLTQLQNDPTVLDAWLQNPAVCNMLQERMAAVHGLNLPPDELLDNAEGENDER